MACAGLCAGLPGVSASYECSVTDPALKLTQDNKHGFYYASTNEELTLLCRCSSIEYFHVGSCKDCTQEQIDDCALESVTEKDPYYGLSVSLWSTPAITSLQGFSKLTGDLPGGVAVMDMSGLTSLDGLGGITSIGQDADGESVVLWSNPKLQSATALEHAGFDEGTLYANNNPHLACVVSAWPATDKENRPIWNGTKCNAVV